MRGHLLGGAGGLEAGISVLALRRPAGRGPFPVVLWIHGGALIFGDRGMLPADERERYLRAGLAVVSIDYRLAPETKLDGILEKIPELIERFKPREKAKA